MAGALSHMLIFLSGGGSTRGRVSSVLNTLSPDVLNIVVGVLRVQGEAETQAAIEASYALRMYYILVNNRSPENVLLYFSLHAKDRAHLSRANVDFLDHSLGYVHDTA
jgi:hypothetical protein